MKHEQLLAETLKILQLDEVAGQQINGYRIESDSIIVPRGARIRLTKTKPFTYLKWLDDSQKQNFRRIMRKVGKPDLSGYDDENKELFLVVDSSLVMIKFDESEKGKSMRQLIYVPLVKHGFHSTFSFKRKTR